MVLRAAEGGAEAFCVRLTGGEKQAPSGARNKSQEVASSLSQPGEPCELQKMSPFVFSSCSFNSKCREKI